MEYTYLERFTRLGMILKKMEYDCKMFIKDFTPATPFWTFYPTSKNFGNIFCLLFGKCKFCEKKRTKVTLRSLIHGQGLPPSP